MDKMVSEAFGNPGDVFPIFALPWLDAFRSGSKYCLLLVIVGIAALYAIIYSTPLETGAHSVKL